MIHILLLILKIIGIVLLILIMLALLVLFFPITYTAVLQYENKKTNGRITAGWLFHIVHFKAWANGTDIRYNLRVFGIPILSSEKKNKKLNKIKNKKKKEETPASNMAKKEQDNVEKTGNANNEKYNEKDAINIETEKTKVKNKRENKIKFSEKIKASFNQIKHKIHDILQNIKKSKDKIKKIKKIVNSQTTKEAYKYGKNIIVKLLKHILPQKIWGNAHFGFKEPHITGETLGYIAMALATFKINPKHIDIEPDFEKEIFEGRLRCRGNILLGVVGIYILKLYFKKEINYIIKKCS